MNEYHERRMDASPLSVVIAAHNASAVIDACLSALLQQACSTPFEVIVSDSSTDATPAIIRERFSAVRLLHFDEPLTIPALRGRGIAIARGAIIAILDPFSVVEPDWVSQVLRAHAQHDCQAIGGSVDLRAAETASYAMWAVFLNEYGLFMSPVTRGETWILPGINLSYKRSVLFDGQTPRHPVFWKTDVNWAIENAGSSLWLEPDIRVHLNKPVPLPDFLRTRYHHGRCFAGMRVRRSSWLTRALRLLSTVAVPFLLMWRWTMGFWPKRGRRWIFVATMPVQLLLFGVWAWGEACGYFKGTGRSCEQLYY